MSEERNNYLVTLFRESEGKSPAYRDLVVKADILVELRKINANFPEPKKVPLTTTKTLDKP